MQASISHRLDPHAARDLFASARVASLATIGPDGRPHLVPVVFSVEGDTIVTAVDAKPKTTRALKRLANVQADPRVTLLADHYEDEDWNALWWVRAEGRGEVLDVPAPPSLVNRYAQYRAMRPQGPVLAVAVDRWVGWRAQG